VKTNPPAFGHPLYQGGNTLPIYISPLDKEGVRGRFVNRVGKSFSMKTNPPASRPPLPPCGINFIKGVKVPLLLKRG
jgi:hypothetical protein